MVEELAFRASAVVWCVRQLSPEHLFANSRNDFAHELTERIRQVDSFTTPWASVPNESVPDCCAEHFLETNCLGTQLQIRRLPVADAGLVFDRANVVTIDFDSIGASRQSQFLRPERNGPHHLLAALAAVLAAVNPSVGTRTSDGMNVIGPDPIAMNQSTLSRTVVKVLDRRNQDYRLRAHNRSLA